MKIFIINLLQRFRKILQYLFYSVLSTVLDVIVVWTAFHMAGIDLAIANTMGIVTGFVLSYVLSLKTVFDTRHGLSAFFVYLSTSAVGMLLANWLITTAYSLSILYCPKWFAFLLSKGISVVLPFFVMYFMRKYIYLWLNKRRS
ncbi:MAG: hypothetical protein HFI16_03035 [Lachnospiraceae bacterium]|nr:hypothetical protein [Lachnospiraceae bacterium]